LHNVEVMYGLRSDSLESYILSNLYKYLDDDIIKTDYVLLSDDQLNQLENLLIEPVYTLEEMKIIVRSIDDNFAEKFINNMNLARVGYKIRSNFILSDNYSSIDEYFRQMILSQD